MGIRKLVISARYGGFGLSVEAGRRLGLTIEEYGEDGDSIPRDDPRLVAVVEEMGDAASGPHARLKVIEIPDDIEWMIEEYDGFEWISEAYRTWHFEE